MNDTLRYYKEWPQIESPIKRSEEIEKEVSQILSLMTLEEKVGQMFQVDMYEVTPEDVSKFKFGALLNGAGVWPDRERRCSAEKWVNTIDEYWQACEKAYENRPFRIPLMWGTDAVHGNNNAFEATVFPHNIALGAARDPDLIFRIGRATASEIRAIGMDWTFAPTVAVSRNSRWGRYYEGYSDDPEIVHSYASRMVEGLHCGLEEFSRGESVISTIKHWIGDGGTRDGIDRGITYCDEEVLLNIHAQGYISGLNAGAQVVMASFNSWSNEANYDHDTSNGKGYNYKVHGSRYLVQDVLKGKMKFDGFVLTDWDGHSEVTACELDDAQYAINAGVDMLMMGGRRDWSSVIPRTVQQVKDGSISMERIDDAVTRILRVKLRAGIFKKTRPNKRPLAGNQSQLGTKENLDLAREAVRKSLVLLKNKNNILPLDPKQKFLVVGEAANDVCRQTGAWTLDWQGTKNTQEDLPKSVTILQAIQQHVGEENVDYVACSKNIDPTKYDKIIFVTGEDPYAEMRGDIKPWRRIAFSELKKSYAQDSSRLMSLANNNVEIVTLFLCGRPLYINPEINASDAFVIVWLPGLRADGITDVIFKNKQGEINFDFQGRLPTSWPKQAYLTAASRKPPHITNYKVPMYEQCPDTSDSVLFPYGYGLSYSNSKSNLYKGDLDKLPLDPIRSPSPIEIHPEGSREIFGVNADASYYVFKMAGRSNWMGLNISTTDEFFQIAGNSTLIDYKGTKDALSIKCAGESILLYAKAMENRTEDLRCYLSSNTEIKYTIRLHKHPTKQVFLALHTDYPNQPALDITERLMALPLGEWRTLIMPLDDFIPLGYDFEHIESPFMLYTEGKMDIDIGEITWHR